MDSQPRKATLINSAGKKAVVVAGSPEASQLMKQGYSLMGAPQAVPSTAADTAGAPNFSDTHSAIQDTINGIQQRLDALKAEDAAAAAPVTPTAPTGITPVSLPNQGETLAQYYARLSNEQGLPQQNTDIANLEGTIRGVEGDITTEANRAGGDVTASQAEGLATSRSTPLYNKLQTLYSIRAAKEDYLDKVVSLTKEDRQAASDRLDKELNLSSTIAQLKQQEDQLTYTQWKDVQTMAQNQVNLLVSNDSISSQSDNALKELAHSSGYTLDSLKSLRSAAKRKIKAEDENNQLAKQKALLDMENTKSEIRTRGASLALQRQELDYKMKNPLTPTEAAQDPLLAFQLKGGKRVQDESGGYQFADAKGNPITVDQAVGMVPGSTRADFLQGSRNAADAPYAYSKNQQQAIGILTDNVRQDKDLANFQVVRDQYQRAQAAADQKNGVGDTSLVYAYMKLLDPTSVVREGEFKSAKEAVGKISELKNVAKGGWFSGTKFTDKGREQFMTMLDQLYGQQTGQYDRTISQYRGQAEAYGIDPNLVLRDYTAPKYSVTAKGKTYTFETYAQKQAFKKKAGIK